MSKPAPHPSRPHGDPRVPQTELLLDTDLYEQFEESVAVYLKDATCLYVNRATEQIFGKPRSELLGRVLWDVFPEAVGNLFYRIFHQVAETEEQAEFDHHYEPWGRWFANRIYCHNSRLYVFGREITAQKKAAETLKLNARILESMAEGVCLSDEEGRIVYVNAAEARMFGYAQEEMAGGMAIQNLHPPEENARIVRDVSAWLRTRGEWEGELLNVRRDGSSFITHARVTALEIAGRPHRVRVQEDVTQKKQSEEWTARLHAMTAALSQAVTPREVATIIVSQGAAALGAKAGGLWLVTEDNEHMELTSSHAFSGEALGRFGHLPLNSPCPIPILRAIRTREPVWVDSMGQLEAEFPGYEATELHRRAGYGFACIPLMVEQRCIGGVTFAFEAGHRIPEDERVLILVLARQCALALERARLYEETQRAQQRSAFLAQASEVLASSLEYEATLNKLVWLAVPTMADWCAVSVLEGSVARLLAVAHQDPRKLELAQGYHKRYLIRLDSPSGVGKVLRTGEPELVTEVSEDALRRITDPERQRLVREIGPTSYICVPLKSRGKVLGAVTFAYAESRRRYTRADLELARDMARRAAIAVDNALLYQEAQEAIRVRDDFLSVASHELKTPLTPLALKLQTLARDTATQPDSPFVGRVRASVELGQRQVKKLTELVNDLLDVSRIVAGRMKLEPEEVDFTGVVREVAASHETHAERVGSRLVLDVQPVRGLWDRLRVEQVVTNLVDNAIKYGAGKPIHIRLDSDGSVARLVVRDEGIGIAREDLSRIFGRFERAVAGRNYGGLGLGLYITRTVVEAMGGEIRVESERGRGATFSVCLPLRMPSPAASEARPRPADD